MSKRAREQRRWCEKSWKSSSTSAIMWQDIGDIVPNPSTFRRLLFAASQLPKATPGYCRIVTDFAFDQCEKKPKPEDTLLLLENMEFLSEQAFLTDKELVKDLFGYKGFKGHPLGVVLVPTNNTCKSCQGDLKIRGDRPSYLTLYTDNLGTVPATLFRKYCSNSHRYTFICTVPILINAPKKNNYECWVPRY